MAVVEALISSHKGAELATELQKAKANPVYVSPFVKKWDITNDGEIVLIGPEEAFLIKLKPKMGNKIVWMCSGYPQKVLKNFYEFFDHQNMGECELMEPVRLSK